MRIYIDGTITQKSERFIPIDLFFSTEENEDLYKVSENCICLSGYECLSSMEGENFSTRWKDVLLTTAENFSDVYNVTEILEAIKGKTLKAIMYYGVDEYDLEQCNIDRITILDNQGTEVIIPKEYYPAPVIL